MKKIFLLLTILISVLFSKGEFKYGIGISNISAPVYIGSKKQKSYTIPFPYISFKSKYLNIKRSKIFTNIYNSKKSKLELSMSALPPVKSKDTLRVGMEDLDAILQIGPKYTYSFFEGKNSLKFEFPVRFAFAIGDELFSYKGYVSDIDFRYSRKLSGNLKLTYITGVSYNSSGINKYYYEVKQNDARVNREAYSLSSGYGGFHNSLALTRKSRHFWIGVFLRHYYLKGVSFEDSPLYEKDEATYTGVAFSYIF